MHAKVNSETGNQSKIRSINREIVLSFLRKKVSSSRIEIVKSLKLAPATVTAVVAELMEDNLIIETTVETPDKAKRSRGRPSREIRLNPNAAFTLGISLRVEHNRLFMDCSWSDYCNKFEIGPTLNCNSLNDFKKITSSIIESVETLLKCLPANANIVGLGIGVPGVVNNNIIELAPNVPALVGEKLFKVLQKKLNFPIFFENDVNLLIIEELEKRPELNHLNVSYLYISQGLGSGTALYGELWRPSGWAGEIGHINIPTTNNELKTLEWLISLDGFIAEEMNHLGYVLDRDEALPESILGDPKTQDIIDRYSQYLHMAIQILNAPLGLDTIIIGTSHPLFVKQFIAPLEQLIENSLLKTNIIFTSTAQSSAVHGATLIALKNSLSVLHSREAE